MARKLIGQVVNTFGLRGALKVVLFTDCPEIRFKEGNSICLLYTSDAADDQAPV